MTDEEKWRDGEDEIRAHEIRAAGVASLLPPLHLAAASAAAPRCRSGFCSAVSIRYPCIPAAAQHHPDNPLQQILQALQELRTEVQEVRTDVQELRTEVQTAVAGVNVRLDNVRRRAHNMIAKGMPAQAPGQMLLQVLAKERQPAAGGAVVGALPAAFPATYAAAREVGPGQTVLECCLCTTERCQTACLELLSACIAWMCRAID